MYAKSVPAPQKFDYPYQEQQRYSGSFIVGDGGQKSPAMSESVLREIGAAAEKMTTAKKNPTPAN